MDESHPIVIFDGVCNLCEDSVAFIIRHDPEGRFRFLSAQSGMGQKLQQQYGVDAIRDGTVILIKDGKVYTRSDAGLEIARDLNGAWRLLAAGKFVPRPARNWIYNRIADNRYRWFGKKSQCIVPDPSVAERFLADE